MPRYIDADALISDMRMKLCGLRNDSYISGDYRTGFAFCMEFVKTATTISPDEARGVGDWKQKEIINLEDTTIEQMQSACCSVCGKYHTTPFSYYFSKYNYCPNCGARMMGVSEDA